MICFTCGEGTFQHSTGAAEGKFRGRKYHVQTVADICTHCGYALIAAPDMPEFMRKLADAYRRERGFLTSWEIKGLRQKLGKMSQQRFAKLLHVGPATVKRWELGMVQSKAHDHLMRLLAEQNQPTYVYEVTTQQELEQHMHGVGREGLPHGPPLDTCFPPVAQSPCLYLDK